MAETRVKIDLSFTRNLSPTWNSLRTKKIVKGNADTQISQELNQQPNYSLVTKTGSSSTKLPKEFDNDIKKVEKMKNRLKDFRAKAPVTKNIRRLITVSVSLL